MIDQARVNAFKQTMTELKAIRERAARAGLARKFAVAWEATVVEAWRVAFPMEQISALKVYDKVVKDAK